MEQLEWKIKIAALWLFQAVNLTAYMLSVYVETRSFLITNSDLSGMDIVPFYFLICLVPWLTFILKPSISRWLNIVFGTIFFLIKIASTVEVLFKRINGELTLGVFINEVWGFIAALFIIWYGLKIPKQAKTA